MATRKTAHRSASSQPRPATVKAASMGKPVALTVKVDKETYVRLCTFGATERRTNQDILLEAVKRYLSQAQA
jgi:hypothetical protein